MAQEHGCVYVGSMDMLGLQAGVVIDKIFGRSALTKALQDELYECAFRPELVCPS
jgi:hypothetical protein